jgi:omega-amidase
MQDLTVTLIQADLCWEDIDANLEMFDRHIDGLEQPGELIILPEMFSTGFSMAARRLAEPMTGKAVTWITEKAAAQNAVITGSLMIKDGGRYYNRLLWARPDGRVVSYDKKHLFRYAGEEKIYAPGQALCTWQIKQWRIRPFVCYDLRFPIWCRNLNQAYDLALFVANWPAKRALHWRQLLIARAIENQAYVIGVNRVGTDGNGHGYDGGSAALDPTGNALFEAGSQPAIHTLTLSGQHLQTYRNAFPAWMDADQEMLNNRQ